MKPVRAIPALAGGLLAAIAAGVAISGCGASATIDPVAQAAEVTSQQAGAHISFSEQISTPGLPSGGLQVTASGYIAWHQRAETLTMNIAGVPGMPGGMTARMVLIYPIFYMNMPVLAGHLPAGKIWAEIDLSKLAHGAGIASSALSSADEWDPSQYLNYLRASSGSVVPVDKETVDGVLTTHYRIGLQLSRVLEHVPSEQQATVRAALEKLGVANEIPVDVWVDEQKRVRRETLTFAGAGVGGGGAGSAATGLSGTITVDFLSFGSVPPVTAPPASEVFDAGATSSLG